MFLCHQLFRQQDKARTPPEGDRDMLFRRLIQIHIRPEADKQHQEDVDEGLSAWKAVRIVESMPDKVQRIDGKARKKDQEQSAVDGFLLHCDLLTCEIHQKEEEYRDTAVDIRPVVKTDLRLHISDMAGDHVKDREIRAPRLRKVKITGRRALQRIDLRKQDSCCQSA